MSHDVPCPRSDGWQAYPQDLLQCSKPLPVLALRSQPHTDTMQRKEGVLQSPSWWWWGTPAGETTKLRPCLLISASVCRLSFLISVSSFSSALFNFTDSNAHYTDGALTHSKEDTLSDGKYFSVFLLISDKLCRIRRMPSSGMWRRVDLVWTDVSEERIAYIFKVENFALQI
jgi:hypothetical protein